MTLIVIREVENPAIVPMHIESGPLTIGFLSRQMSVDEPFECSMHYDKRVLPDNWGEDLPGWQYLLDYSPHVGLAFAACSLEDVINHLISKGHNVVLLGDIWLLYMSQW